LKLVDDVKSDINQIEYKKLKRMFERTLLTVRLRAAVAAVYYGARIKPNTLKVSQIIKNNKSEANKVIKEIEDYNLSYPIGEYNWKKDSELARVYINDN